MNEKKEMSLVEWCENLIPGHKVNKELNLIRETLNLLVDKYLDLEEIPDSLHKIYITSSIEILKKPDNQSLQGTGGTSAKMKASEK